ncbi:hypothetical protein ADUPG1_001150 [Aduncisulcus paluster]|uniref:PI3K/PI4K catalytic domain-containing protein n=1 Tax=Aduncisulcus paluster TaxID=2918883 RepID=A0ABQ5KEN8_9EUKA|nr:hypothetical protein ADUPG1_001150 [Aduncisulcus paluster]
MKEDNLLSSSFSTKSTPHPQSSAFLADNSGSGLTSSVCSLHSNSHLVSFHIDEACGLLSELLRVVCKSLDTVNEYEKGELSDIPPEMLGQTAPSEDDNRDAFDFPFFSLCAYVIVCYRAIAEITRITNHWRGSHLYTFKHLIHINYSYFKPPQPSQEAITGVSNIHSRLYKCFHDYIHRKPERRKYKQLVFFPCYCDDWMWNSMLHSLSLTIIATVFPQIEKTSKGEASSGNESLNGTTPRGSSPAASPRSTITSPISSISGNPSSSSSSSTLSFLLSGSSMSLSSLSSLCSFLSASSLPSCMLAVSLLFYLNPFSLCVKPRGRVDSGYANRAFEELGCLQVKQAEREERRMNKTRARNELFVDSFLAPSPLLPLSAINIPLSFYQHSHLYPLCAHSYQPLPCHHACWPGRVDSGYANRAFEELGCLQVKQAEREERRMNKTRARNELFVDSFLAPSPLLPLSAINIPLSFYQHSSFFLNVKGRKDPNNQLFASLASKKSLFISERNSEGSILYTLTKIRSQLESMLSCVKKKVLEEASERYEKFKAAEKEREEESGTVEQNELEKEFEDSESSRSRRRRRLRKQRTSTSTDGHHSSLSEQDLINSYGSESGVSILNSLSDILILPLETPFISLVPTLMACLSFYQTTEWFCEQIRTNRFSASDLETFVDCFMLVFNELCKSSSPNSRKANVRTVGGKQRSSSEDLSSTLGGKSLMAIRMFLTSINFTSTISTPPFSLCSLIISPEAPKSHSFSAIALSLSLSHPYFPYFLVHLASGCARNGLSQCFESICSIHDSLCGSQPWWNSCGCLWEREGCTKLRSILLDDSKDKDHVGGGYGRNKKDLLIDHAVSSPGEETVERDESNEKEAYDRQIQSQLLGISSSSSLFHHFAPLLHLSCDTCSITTPLPSLVLFMETLEKEGFGDGYGNIVALAELGNWEKAVEKAENVSFAHCLSVSSSTGIGKHSPLLASSSRSPMFSSFEPGCPFSANVSSELKKSYGKWEEKARLMRGHIPDLANHIERDISDGSGCLFEGKRREKLKMLSFVSGTAQRDYLHLPVSVLLDRVFINGEEPTTQTSDSKDITSSSHMHSTVLPPFSPSFSSSWGKLCVLLEATKFMVGHTNDNDGDQNISLAEHRRIEEFVSFLPEDLAVSLSLLHPESSYYASRVRSVGVDRIRRLVHEREDSYSHSTSPVSSRRSSSSSILGFPALGNVSPSSPIESVPSSLSSCFSLFSSCRNRLDSLHNRLQQLNADHDLQQKYSEGSGSRIKNPYDKKYIQTAKRRWEDDLKMIFSALSHTHTETVKYACQILSDFCSESFVEVVPDKRILFCVVYLLELLLGLGGEIVEFVREMNISGRSPQGKGSISIKSEESQEETYEEDEEEPSEEEPVFKRITKSHVKSNLVLMSKAILLNEICSNITSFVNKYNFAFFAFLPFFPQLLNGLTSFYADNIMNGDSFPSKNPILDVNIVELHQNSDNDEIKRTVFLSSIDSVCYTLFTLIKNTALTFPLITAQHFAASMFDSPTVSASVVREIIHKPHDQAQALNSACDILSSAIQSSSELVNAYICTAQYLISMNKQRGELKKFLDPQYDFINYFKRRQTNASSVSSSRVIVGHSRSSGSEKVDSRLKMCKFVTHNLVKGIQNEFLLTMNTLNAQFTPLKLEMKFPSTSDFISLQKQVRQHVGSPVLLEGKEKEYEFEGGQPQIRRKSQMDNSLLAVWEKCLLRIGDSPVYIPTSVPVMSRKPLPPQQSCLFAGLSCKNFRQLGGINGSRQIITLSHAGSTLSECIKRCKGDSPDTSVIVMQMFKLFNTIIGSRRDGVNESDFGRQSPSKSHSPNTMSHASGLLQSSTLRITSILSSLGVSENVFFRIPTYSIAKMNSKILSVGFLENVKTINEQVALATSTFRNTNRHCRVCKGNGCKVVSVNKNGKTYRRIDPCTNGCDIHIKYQSEFIKNENERYLSALRHASDDKEERERRCIDRFKLLLTHTKPYLGDLFNFQFGSSARSLSFARSTYTHSLAASSAACMFFGIGDRHPDNIMLQNSPPNSCVHSCCVAHIDTEYAFEASVFLLPMPDDIPFRLTQNIIHALGCAGCGGPFVEILAEAISRVKNERDMLMSMLQWTIGVFYQGPRRGRGEGEKRTFRGKLYEEISSTQQAINSIRMATDPERLGTLFHGWRAWM